jgi:PadR family transcriptional regulator PadR
VLLRLEQISAGKLQIQQGSLYPALYRLEHQGLIKSEWGESENKRRAKFYTLTTPGRRRLQQEETYWNDLSDAVRLVLRAVPEDV